MNSWRAGLFALLIAGCASALAQSASLPLKRDGGEDDALVYRALGAFALACAVAGGLAWGAKRYAPRLAVRRGGGDALERLETLRLTPRSTLFLVRWREQEMVLAESPSGLQVISYGEPATKTEDGHG